MSKIIQSFVINKQGVGEILKSAEVEELIDKKSKQICENANSMTSSGDGYEYDVRVGKRAVGRVQSVTDNAFWGNYHHNYLEKAISKSKGD